ncbi:hypothetical protein Tco_0720353 [Tanacetum coccineum]
MLFTIYNMAHIQEVTPDAAENSGNIFDAEPLHKVQNNNDNYNVFAIENAHPEQPESVNDIYLEEQGGTNITIDSLGMCYDREQDDQDNTDELDQERDLLASLIDKLKCEIDDSKNRNKFLESSHKALVDKLKGEIEDFKTKNKSLESSNNHFKEANNELSKTNQLMFKDLKKFQAELDKYHDVNYASKVEIDCAKAKGDLMSYKIEFEKSSNEYTRKINDLNQTISDMKKELFAHQETISIMSQEKEAQIKFYKTREDKELDKVIALENKVKVLDDIVYKTGQSVQTMNMLNRNCKTSFAKPEFLKKAQRANPRLYDIGCYNDNLALMLAPESDETIRLAKESRSKLSDLIRPFDYDQLNNLYDLFVPQREKSPEQQYFSKESKMSHTSANNEIFKESFNKQTTLLEKRMDESIPWDQKCKSSKELFKIKRSVDTIFDGVELYNVEGKEEVVFLCSCPISLPAGEGTSESLSVCINSNLATHALAVDKWNELYHDLPSRQLKFDIIEYVLILSGIKRNLMLPVVISYVNAAIDTTAIGFKRRRFSSALNIETLVAAVERRKTPIDETVKGLGPGCIFTLTGIAKWECSSYGRALTLHARGTGFDSSHFLIFSLWD